MENESKGGKEEGEGRVRGSEEEEEEGKMECDQY